MNQPSRSTSSEPTPAGSNPASAPTSSLPDRPTRVETAVVLGLLLVGMICCLILYGRPILAMLGLLGQAVRGGR